ncbi:TPA: hypothetical protein ACXIV6_000985 [Enterobacter roggenkampii]
MSVKRYSVWEDEMFEEKHAIKSNNGMVHLMVKHEDYAALEQKLAESQREFRAADATIENLQMQVERLAAESEERRQFILNGVEFSYIRLPDEDTADSAKATYERCLIVSKYAPCQKCNDTGMTDSGGTQPWGESIEIECDCLAAQLRKGAQS